MRDPVMAPAAISSGTTTFPTSIGAPTFSPVCVAYGQSGNYFSYRCEFPGGKPVQPTQYKTHDFLALLLVTLLVINIGIS